jgi:hypothetical protein
VSLAYYRAKEPSVRQDHAETIEAIESRPDHSYPVAVVHTDPVRYLPVQYWVIAREVEALLGE